MARIRGADEVFQVDTYVIREIPSGTINGANTDFTLANTPQSNTETIMLNGMVLNVTDDYTILGDTITFINAPISGDRILVTYLKQ